MTTKVVNLDSHRKVPSAIQQRGMVKEFVIQEVQRAYQHLRADWVHLACDKAVKAVDKGAGFDDAYMVASRYINETLASYERSIKRG